MGYFVRYEGKLEINPTHFRGALDTFNKLHSPEMLEKYARGVSGQNKWYSWVRNPQQPYRTLKEAFENWGFFDNYFQTYIDEDTFNFVVEGEYDNKLGQQEFLLEHLAPYLSDTVISVTGEDGWKYIWMVESGNFNTYSYRDTPISEPKEYTLLPEHLEEENMSLAMGV